jgi:YHS domain-containing protein
MHMLLALALLVTVPAVPQGPARERTFPLDPVELQAGREVAGKPELALRHGKFTYRFASEATRTRFEEDPTLFEIQQGGACARMGPLSGEGSISIHVVHDGRIYLFASKQCREGFLKAPHLMLESDDPAPKASAAQIERGHALFERALAAHGGAARIDGVRTYSERSEADVDSGGTTYRVIKARWIDFDGRARSEESWNGKGWATVRAAEEAFAFPANEDLADSQRRAFDREQSHALLAVLRAGRAGDAVVVHVGSSELGRQGIEYVAIARSGVTHTLGIDPETGRVLSLAFRDRGPNATLGRVERRFRDLREVAGILVPFAWSTTFDGEPSDALAIELAEIEIDEALDPKLFTRS